MLAGGLSRPDSLYTQMGFSQLRALARTGRCAPFDAAGSGLVVGEGAGVVVLKRLSDALRDGDRIQALIRGIGLSNDLDGNLLSPAAEGQLRALHQACAQAGWAPSDVDLIECHATGTPVGDAVEFESLLKFWQNDSWRPGQCVLGAVKANIGHLLTGAGSAGLIKILLSLEHRTLPPIPNFNEPARTIPPGRQPVRNPPPKPAVGSPRQLHAPPRRHQRVRLRRHQRPRSHRRMDRHGTGPAQSPQPARTRQSRSPLSASAPGWGPGPRWRPFKRGSSDKAPETPAQRASWRGVPASELPAPADGPAGIAGYYLDDLALPVNRYRIPPKGTGRAAPAASRHARSGPRRPGRRRQSPPRVRPRRGVHRPGAGPAHHGFSLPLGCLGPARRPRRRSLRPAPHCRPHHGRPGRRERQPDRQGIPFRRTQPHRLLRGRLRRRRPGNRRARPPTRQPRPSRCRRCGNHRRHPRPPRH